MGEAKRKREAAAATTILPEEVKPRNDHLLLRPLMGSEKTRGGVLWLPPRQAVLAKARGDAVKKQFGTILEQPRLTVVAIGPKVSDEFAPGDEVIPCRKAVAYNGTAVSISGVTGVYFMCKEEEIIAKIERLPDDEATKLYEHYGNLAEEEAANEVRGRIVTDPNEPPPEVAALPELPDEPVLVKP